MNRLITATILATFALVTNTSAGAAELQRAPIPSSLDKPSYTVSAKPIPKRLETRQFFEHTCASEGYECASGYQCEFIMSRSGEDEHGNPVDLGYNRTNLRFYNCNATGRTSQPSCSLGLTPSGFFHSSIQGDLRKIPGGVRVYHCQQAL
jgi:hypothetical protein